MKDSNSFWNHMVFTELLETNNWVGVKIPRPGYLVPNPWFQAKYVKKSIIQTNRINSITMIAWKNSSIS